MTLYWQDAHRTLYNGNCRAMTELADNSIQCCVTSPPYWGLRRYAGEQDSIWGGSSECRHEWGEAHPSGYRKSDTNPGAIQGKGTLNRDKLTSNTCSFCGAWRGAYGLEPTVDLYVAHSVEILREIRRVLRPDGVCFWNIGDSYNGSGGDHKPDGKNDSGFQGKLYRGTQARSVKGLKPKDLCLIPFRVAIAAQEPYQQFTIKSLADRAWMAGIIDGEGCIGIHHGDRGEGENHYHQFQPFISIGSIDSPLIERIVRITRMNGTRQKTEPGDMDGRGIISRHANYEWRVEGANAIKIIEDVYPDLTIKRKQAVIAYELANCHAPHSGRGHKVPTDVTTHKLILWQMIKDCNQRKDVDVNFPEPTPHIEPGWWVRSVIIWNKPNPMPESVTDRPTESHEYILMLTKSARYYWDMEAVREDCFTGNGASQGIASGKRFGGSDDNPVSGFGSRELFNNPNGRNLRSVWSFPAHGYAGAHFATFPEKLPELCIRAATPEEGCCSKCGRPWERIVEKSGGSIGKSWHNHENDLEQGMSQTHSIKSDGYKRIDKGWQAACKCNADKVPSVVLDPFCGAGTTLKVAAELNRHAVGYEISEEYCGLIVNRNKQGVIL